MVDALKLDAVQLALLNLYEGPFQEPAEASSTAIAVQSEASHRLAVRDALGAAMQRLLVDLNNHVKLLGALSCYSTSELAQIKDFNPFEVCRNF